MMNADHKLEYALRVAIIVIQIHFNETYLTYQRLYMNMRS